MHGVLVDLEEKLRLGVEVERALQGLADLQGIIQPLNYLH